MKTEDDILLEEIEELEQILLEDYPAIFKQLSPRTRNKLSDAFAIGPNSKQWDITHEQANKSPYKYGVIVATTKDFEPFATIAAGDFAILPNPHSTDPTHWKNPELSWDEELSRGENDKVVLAQKSHILKRAYHLFYISPDETVYPRISLKKKRGSQTKGKYFDSEEQAGRVFSKEAGKFTPYGIEKFRTREYDPELKTYLYVDEPKDWKGKEFIKNELIDRIKKYIPKKEETIIKKIIPLYKEQLQKEMEKSKEKYIKSLKKVEETDKEMDELRKKKQLSPEEEKRLRKIENIPFPEYQFNKEYVETVKKIQDIVNTFNAFKELDYKEMSFSELRKKVAELFVKMEDINKLQKETIRPTAVKKRATKKAQQ